MEKLLASNFSSIQSTDLFNHCFALSLKLTFLYALCSTLIQKIKYIKLCTVYPVKNNKQLKFKNGEKLLASNFSSIQSTDLLNLNKKMIMASGIVENVNEVISVQKILLSFLCRTPKNQPFTLGRTKTQTTVKRQKQTY